MTVFVKKSQFYLKKELENEIMSTVQQYPELMSAMKSYNENHDFEKVSEHQEILPLKKSVSRTTTLKKSVTRTTTLKKSVTRTTTLKNL